MNKKSLCFATVSSPHYLGGYSLYHKNLAKILKKSYDLSWVYFGEGNAKYKKDGVTYFEIKTNKFKSATRVGEIISLSRFFNKNYFDIINTTVGLREIFYKKREKQKIIQTFHGTAYYFNKNHFERFNLIQKILLAPILFFGWLREKPHPRTDMIICVSEKVKRQVQRLYGKGFDTRVIRTGVDLKDFKKRDKQKIRRRLNLEGNKLYALYVGRGGFWTKGLDRAVMVGKEMYREDKDFRLIVIGSDPKKTKHLLKEPFLLFLESVARDKMPLYYSSSDMFFCMSRYEGGAPTLVVSEAMASGCLLVCSKDSEQEIIVDGKNGLLVEKFNKKESQRILNIIKDEKLREKIVKNSQDGAKNLSLDKWGRECLKAIDIN
ncbi:MAG: glycosyltransferase family 4 protein [Nanoarchaeota archaeon]|nr:glycosyltransferase family 4 protein [Nanoarchaeota archaeon]